jgi:hypothetical protein
MEMNGHDVGSVGSVVHKLPAVLLLLVTSPVCSRGPGVAVKNDNAVVQQSRPFATNDMP